MVWLRTASLLLSLVGIACASTLNTKADVSPARLFSRASSGCPAGGPLSCHNTTVQDNLCCFEAPGGSLLQTQFWDTSGPGTALPTNWTIHGLWPDHCDGTFSENCDPTRAYTNISTLLTNAGQNATLDFMEQFWLNINGNNPELWAHEWVTHGTCYSTLQRTCLPAGSPIGTEAVDFFVRVVNLYKTLPTFQFLESQGIVPSSTRTFTLSQLTTALKTASGFAPALDCSGSALSGVSWYFNLQGSLIDGTFFPIDAPFPGSCGQTGLTYPIKP